MASTAGQTVPVHLATSCLPCITLGQAPTSRHTQSSTQTAFPTMAIQRDVVFVKATKIEPFLGRLSRAGLLKSIWTAHLPTQQTIALGPRRAGSSSQSVDSNVPQRAHKFVSIQLAVPRARPASRQQLSLKPERLLMYQISMSDTQERVGYSDNILCRYTEHNHKNIKRKRLWLSTRDISSGRFFAAPVKYNLIGLSSRNSTLVNQTYHIWILRPLTIYSNSDGPLRRRSLGSALSVTPYRAIFILTDM